MESLVFDCIWGKASAPEVDRVKELWRKYSAIDREERIEVRARQIVFVVKTSGGEVVGVSTARPVQVAFLNNHFFYEFRCFVAPYARTPGLDSLLAQKTRDYLETLPESASKFKGMLLLVENDELRRQRTKAVWPATGMIFAGYTSRGDHIRISYFKGARI